MQMSLVMRRRKSGSTAASPSAQVHMFNYVQCTCNLTKNYIPQMAQPYWSEWTCYGFALRISMFKPVSVHMSSGSTRTYIE